MIPKRQPLVPRARSARLRIDLRRADAYVLKPRDYEEIPELTDEWFRRATLHIGGVPVPRGPGMRVRIDQAKRKAGMVPKVRRKKARNAPPRASYARTSWRWKIT
jgi:hypothetical protein